VFVKEETLVNAYINNHKNTKFLIRECDFRWGNIDVVEYEVRNEVYLNPDQVKALRINRNLLVFSSLYRKRGLKLETVTQRSGMDIGDVSYILRKLVNLNIVVKNDLTYAVNPLIDFPDIVMFAYEMKLSDIRKAINQAVINKTYCDYSYIVFPDDKAQLCQKYFETLTRNGIGLILVNDDKNVEIIRAKKSEHHGISLLNSKLKVLESRICIQT